MWFFNWGAYGWDTKKVAVLIGEENDICEEGERVSFFLEALCFFALSLNRVFHRLSSHVVFTVVITYISSFSFFSINMLSYCSVLFILHFIIVVFLSKFLFPPFGIIYICCWSTIYIFFINYFFQIIQRLQ